MTPTTTPVGIVNRSKNAVVGCEIRVATSAWSRLVGLLGEAGLDPGGGLLIAPSSGIHTWGMLFPIDVVALDRNMRVLGTWERVGGFRMAAIGWKTRSVLELPVGTIRRSRIEVNDQLAIAACANGSMDGQLGGLASRTSKTES